jgi:DNA-directed RNA polymerase beta' subunit
MTRLLTIDEIENIINFIEPQKGIPLACAKSICERNKERFRVQLRGQLVNPEIIPELKTELSRAYQDSLIQPGEAVGVICAQSIGEKNTQTALNTFHKAGQSETTMTEGVPRFQELLNATRNQKMVNHLIFFNDGNDTVKKTRETVGDSITGFTLKDLTTKCTSVPNIQNREPWFKPSLILKPCKFDDLSSCVTIMLNVPKMFEYKITHKQVSDAIESEYDDLYCMFSPVGDGRLDIYVDPTNVICKIEENIAFITPENAMEIYMEDVVEPNISNIPICGIQGILEIFYSVDKNEWFIETNATNSDPRKLNILQKIMSLPTVDDTRTTSNNIWEIYETLGVEATKAFLVEEFMSIMDGINECHARLLVDRMTFSGSIASISRYTLKQDECGPMGKASFEESLDNFLNAASQGEVEPTRGISASIICGKRSHTGTGIMGLKMNLDACKI